MFKPTISFMCGTKIGTKTKDFEVFLFDKKN